jgi:hypothetical protein
MADIVEVKTAYSSMLNRFSMQFENMVFDGIFSVNNMIRDMVHFGGD